MVPIDFPDTQKHFRVTFRGTSHFAHSRCAPPFEIFGAGHSYPRTGVSNTRGAIRNTRGQVKSCREADLDDSGARARQPGAQELLHGGPNAQAHAEKDE